VPGDAVSIRAADAAAGTASAPGDHERPSPAAGRPAPRGPAHGAAHGAAASTGLPAGFRTLIGAQFCSALADHALLIVTIALLQRAGAAAWWPPLLKFAFTLAYVGLAPLVGPLADAWPKARVMAWTHALKAVGVLALALGCPPLAAFALVGVGAAAYAPAKYGLITELVPAGRLVRANAWIEVSVVGAVLLGAVLGGLLVSPAWLALVAEAGASLAAGDPAAGMHPAIHHDRRADGAGPHDGAPWAGPLGASLAALLALYALAAALNRRIPDSGAALSPCSRDPRTLWRDHLDDHRRLWTDRQGGALSLAATTLFWGVGATLQFIVLRWAHEGLGLPLDRAAALQGVVAIGVVAGASLAGRWVPLHAARHLLWLGVPLGLAMPLLLRCHDLTQGVALLVAAGAIAGFMVVPLNALLQHRGLQLTQAGRSIAVQGCAENAGILLLLGLYAALTASGLPLQYVGLGLGLLVAVAMPALIGWQMRYTRRTRRR
jgi:MFS family permease